MDIKSKKFNDYLAVRVIAFVLCIATLLVSATTVFIGTKKVSDLRNNNSFDITVEDLSQNDNYMDSRSFANWTEGIFENMATLGKYVSRDEIKTGKYVSDSSLEPYLIEEYYNEQENGSLEGNEVYIDPDYEYEYKDYEAVKGDFAHDFPEAVQRAKNSEISYQLGEYDYAKRHLESINGVTYTIKKGKAVLSNNESGKTNSNDLGYTLNVQNGKITSTPESKSFVNSDSYGLIQERSYESANAGTTYNLTVDADVINDVNEDFNGAKNVYNQYSIVAVTTFIAFLILLIYLFIITGRRDGEGKVKLYRSDKLYTELQFLIVGTLCGLAALPIWMLVNAVGDLSVVTWMQETHNIAFIMLGIALEAVIVSGILWFTLSIIRMLKAHIFIKRSLIVIAVKVLYKWIKAAFSRVNPMGKFIIIIVAACLLSMTVFFAPVVIILLFGFGYNWIRKYTAVKKGVEEVTSGNLDYKIPVDSNSNNEFDQLARQINTISQASNIAIQNELKNQRLKTDLISNVSHDLKTPLTSIITYTDLMKKEGLDSPNAAGYLDVIDEKGRRLKTLTEDLFEAAKASSGSIPVRLEKVDVLSLINQGVVELDEGLKAKGLDVIINAEKDKYYVNADSQLLWRIVENLLNNVEKYALENSRVYIDINEKQVNEQSKPMVFFEMKNMSKAPLNIPEDELMERFKRGDESRTTEGSGLGLAIAKDLTRLQNGVFELKIDGDLFKSTVMLEAYDEETIKAAAALLKEETEIEERMYQHDDSMPKIRN